MRKLTLIAAAGLLAAPMMSEAKPLNDLLLDKGALMQDSAGAFKGYYQDGTRLEFGDKFDLKMNLGVVTSYSYTDWDHNTARGLQDANSFEVDRVRLELAGNFMNKEFSYMVQNDFAGDADFVNNSSNGSDVRDAWLQWNWCEGMGLRMGQFVLPFGRQALGNPFMSQMPFRTDVSELFVPGRAAGLMAMGDLGDAAMWSLAVYNGESTGEGLNSGGVDSELGFAGMVVANMGDYGSRAWEGDYGMTADWAFTMGLGATYDQGSVLVQAGDALASLDYDKVRVGADVGARYQGFSLQSEIFWANTDPDGSDEKIKDLGFYVQSGYFFVPKEWEVAGRFGVYNPDEDTSALDDMMEYDATVGYYLNGHSMKMLMSALWRDQNPADSSAEDTTDFRAQLTVSAYL